LIITVSALAGVAIAAVIARSVGSSTKSSSPPAVYTTWGVGQRPAPELALRDEKGNPITLASLRGRPAIVTFIDPLCRNFCPREASVLSQAAAALGKDAPAIVSVSVNPWADSAQNFGEDKAHWRLAPSWRWGVGSYAQLAKVWKSYGVAVVVSREKIAGISVRRITHTGAAYILDANGFERALLLYPFTSAEVVSATRGMLSAGM
jgi:protein SCO1/2